MYFLTSIAVIESSPRGETHKRCFGYYLSLDEAVAAVKENRGNMVECFYDYLVIEKIGPGIHADAEQLIWFEYDLDSNSWKPCNKPAFAKSTINFAIG